MLTAGCRPASARAAPSRRGCSGRCPLLGGRAGARHGQVQGLDRDHGPIRWASSMMRSGAARIEVASRRCSYSRRSSAICASSRSSWSCPCWRHDVEHDRAHEHEHERDCHEHADTGAQSATTGGRPARLRARGAARARGVRAWGRARAASACAFARRAGRPRSSQSLDRGARSARGFASTSSADGRTGRRVPQPGERVATAAGTAGHVTGLLGARPVGEVLLDQAILERVVGEHDLAAVRPEQMHRLVERGLEARERGSPPSAPLGTCGGRGCLRRRAEAGMPRFTATTRSPVVSAAVPRRSPPCAGWRSAM